MRANKISYDLLHKLFKYKDGELIRSVRVGPYVSGITVGSKCSSSGYVRVGISGTQYLVHRLIYIMHNGEIPCDMQVDHIDRNKTNNHIENLRMVSNAENQFNRDDAKGCSFNKPYGKWISEITVYGKRINLGFFDNMQDAHMAYLNAKKSKHLIGVA